MAETGSPNWTVSDCRAIGDAGRVRAVWIHEFHGRVEVRPKNLVSEFKLRGQLFRVTPHHLASWLTPDEQV
jgi:hypothetical protein